MNRKALVRIFAGDVLLLAAILTAVARFHQMRTVDLVGIMALTFTAGVYLARGISAMVQNARPPEKNEPPGGSRTRHGDRPPKPLVP